MRIISWNVRGATKSSPAWSLLCNLNPDVALLQEVRSIPKDVSELFDVKLHRAVTKGGKPQRFGTAILVKGKIISELPLSSEYDWVNRELKHFSGNLVSCVAKPDGYPELKLISVYSPAWPVDAARLKGIDVAPVKLTQNPDVWVTELLWSALKNANLSSGKRWVVGGDFNTSETFDETFSSGNAEVLERMNNLGLTECLRAYKGKLTPTFRNPSDGKIIHQIDHLFVTNNLYSEIVNCTTGKQSDIFKKSISSSRKCATFPGRPG